jgi:hypothetical protein
MHRKKILLLASLFIMSTVSMNADAALKRDNQDDPKAAYNPKETKGDIELPMPDGMKMVMRAVPVECGDYLHDKRINLGMRNTVKEREKYDSSFTSYLGSSIKYEDLPKDWQNKVDFKGNKNYCYYFIGKYELSNGQWTSIMGKSPECMDTANGDDKYYCQPQYPKTKISWYDIQEFLQKYNNWLMAQKFDGNKLPVVDGSPMYFRLPTEAEWEYAAKGGNVSPEEEELQFGDESALESLKNIAVFGTSDKPRSIGSMNPNRLFLYDTSGNVEELIGDGFRFSVPEMVNGKMIRRLHGSEGGLIIKGGSYLSKEAIDVTPGKRNEIKMFIGSTNKGFEPFKARTVGTRLVFSSINVQSQRKESQLSQISLTAINTDSAQKKEPYVPAEVNDELSNRIVIGDGNFKDDIANLYNTANTVFMKNNLKLLMDKANDYDVAIKSLEDRNLLNTMRTDTYMVDAIRNSWFRFFSQSQDITAVYALSDDKDIEKQMEPSLKMASLYFDSLEINVSRYILAVEEAKVYKPEILKEKVEILKNEYSEDKHYHKVFRENIDVFYKHVLSVQKKNKLSFDKVMSDLGLYSSKSEKLIREYKKTRKLEKSFLMKTFPEYLN